MNRRVWLIALCLYAAAAAIDIAAHLRADSQTGDVRQPDVATFDTTVRDVIAGSMGPAGGEIGLTGMSEAYGLPNGDAQTSPATRFAFALARRCLSTVWSSRAAVMWTSRS